MKEFVGYIIKNLVDQPDKVQINELRGAQTFIYEVNVDKADIGKLIGKKGRTINAIRVLVAHVAHKLNIRATLEIVEEGKPSKSQQQQQAHQPSN